MNERHMRITTTPLSNLRYAMFCLDRRGVVPPSGFMDDKSGPDQLKSRLVGISVLVILIVAAFCYGAFVQR